MKGVGSPCLLGRKKKTPNAPNTVVDVRRSYRIALSPRKGDEDAHNSSAVGSRVRVLGVGVGVSMTVSTGAT